MSVQYVAATSVANAISLTQDCGVGARLIAGGTDLVIQMRRKILAPTHLIDIQPLDELKQVRIDDRQVEIGALVTHKEIERRFSAHPRLAGLVESARIVGGHQVRNSGTIGGNICNASPAADLLPILLVLEASVELQGPDGSRSELLESFLKAPGRTTRQPNEILTRIIFATPPRSAASAFLRAGRRRAMEISLVSTAVLLVLDQNQKCTLARIAIGAAAPTAFRASEAESVLTGASITPDLLQAAGEAAAAAAKPLSDVRASEMYRRRLVRVMTSRALDACVQRIGQ
jgi:carbon-monoxide dehydrogenase medium subunit